ncbi:MAG: CHRD domain-containing protein [Actinomycetota bacterium]
MTRRTIAGIGLFALIAGILAATPGTSLAAKDKEILLQSQLSGDQVVQGGDPDGSGVATILVDAKDGVACFDVQTTNVDTPITGYIYSGSAGTIGFRQVLLFENSQEASVNGCVPADRKTLRKIGRNPEQYNLAVSNDGFPAGAIRGQLEPTT